MAETKVQATKAFDSFLREFEAKYPKAVGVLEKDRETTLGLLRHSRRALHTHPDDEPDRIQLCDHSPSDDR